MSCILVIGNPNEPMIRGVYDELVGRGRPVELLQGHDLPGTVRLGLSLCGTDGRDAVAGFFALADGRTIDFADVTSVYQRVGFFESETWEDYTPEDARYANAECHAATTVLLDSLPALVVNRPIYSGSNASKPYQIGLVEQYGFHIPHTLVTNQSEDAVAFYEAFDGNVIYKSISYLRSIVRRMTAEDLGRLDTLRNCPIQLQERVEGEDIRVHVVGQDRLFASMIRTEESDYRYDRGVQVTEHTLPPEIAQQCFAVARALGFVLTGIDLRVTKDGRYYCFEVNPSPAFTWYEGKTKQPITAALCDVLDAPETAGFLP